MSEASGKSERLPQETGSGASIVSRREALKFIPAAVAAGYVGGTLSRAQPDKYPSPDSPAQVERYALDAYMNAENGKLKRNFDLYKEWRKMRRGEQSVFEREISLSAADRENLTQEYTGISLERDNILDDLDSKLISNTLKHYGAVYGEHLKKVTHDDFHFGDDLGQGGSFDIPSGLSPEVEFAVKLLTVYVEAGGDVRGLVYKSLVNEEAAKNIKMVVLYPPLEKRLFDPPFYWFQRRDLPPTSPPDVRKTDA